MTFIGSLRRSIRLGTQGDGTPAAGSRATAAAIPVDGTRGAPAVEIRPSDPLFAVLQSSSGPVDAERLQLDSPALDELRAAGIRVIVPLVAQGELIGALYLGPRLSDQEYSTDDRRLLATLAAQAAPAIRVAQLVREQAAELQQRERLEQELRFATLIQQQFLPHELPDLPDWQVAAYYGPARAVGGDFYDFIPLPDGRIGVVVGDVTDKGVPAALIMARTHSVLRGEAPRLVRPGAVLARANELLCLEMPSKMFVTCLYAVLDPATGAFDFANAGHNLPYVRGRDGVRELRATGMPLGLMPGMTYEESEATIAPDESVLLYSDGIVEAHDPGGEMYGFPRLQDELLADLAGSELLDRVLETLHAFTGQGWEQEDDITMVTLRRAAGPGASGFEATDPGAGVAEPTTSAAVERVLLDLQVPGEPGNEQAAMERVTEAVGPLDLEPPRLERLRTAVSEATMNAIEYGSQGRPEVPVRVLVTASDRALVVRITDAGLGGPPGQAEQPDLDAKLAGLQKPRGWGLFLIDHMVDSFEIVPTADGQTAVLTLFLEGGGDERQAAHD
ncbi:MAG TPA: SpoIIE family protein phosphatase [Candidatus Dormibacteraeota bacterium]|nr:SpoIIE family protein phosphatase [Candidatus Dormibacteraeota bacterium]